MYCKDYTAQELVKKFPNGKSLMWYVTEIEAYVERACVKNAACGNLPGCPFARAEMVKDRIQYEFININDGITDDHIELIQKFHLNDNKKTMMVIVLDKKEIGSEEGIALAAEYTKKYRKKYNIKDKIVALLSNYENDHDPYVDPPEFLFFLVQYEKDLIAGEKTLRELGYYDDLTEDQFITDGTIKGGHPILREREKTKCPINHHNIDKDGNIDFFEDKEE